MTTMATKVRLAVGQPQTVITVTECVEVEGNYGPQAQFTGPDDRGTALPVYDQLEVARKELSRIALDLTSANGQRLAFWKETASNTAGKTFPALRIALPAGAVARTQPAPTNGAKAR